MTGSGNARCKSHAFTLIEVMIVCGLVAVLLAFAIPSYQRYLMRTYRGAAVEVLLGAAACQERIYATQLNYDTSRCLSGIADAHYRYRFEPAGTAEAGSFVVIGEPLQTQIMDPCGSLSLDETGRRGIDGPSEILSACWEGR